MRVDMRRAWAVLLVAGAVAAAGQGTVADNATVAEAVRWASGLSDRFRRLSNPVTSAWALEELGIKLCEHDQAVGAGLLRDAIARVKFVPDDAFQGGTGPVLPVASFTKLWRVITANAVECDPSLASAVNVQQYEDRILEERREANTNVANAQQHIDEYPERTAQVLRGSIEIAEDAKDPTLLNFSLMGKYLSELRDRAPELADEAFPLAADLVASAPAPSTALLNELGKYLFVAAKLLYDPDKKYEALGTIQNGVEITDFSAVRFSTDPGAEEAYIDAALRMLPVTTSANYSAAQAYSIASQLVPKARDLELDSLEDLQKLVTQIKANLGGTPSASTQAGTDLDTPAARRARAVRLVLSAIRGKRIEEARRLVPAVDDQADRQQLLELIDFGEGAAAIGAKDISRAVQAAGQSRAGVKRSMLYAGLMANATAEIASQQVDLLARDAAVVPAEFRTLVLSLGAGALFGRDPERALTVLNDAVTALNASGSRKARYDPATRRTVFTGGAATGTDVPVIRYGETQLLETVDAGGSRTGGIRMNFELSAPGATTYTVPAAVKAAKGVDYRRIEGTVLGLRDEWRQAQALLALVELRLGK